MSWVNGTSLHCPVPLLCSLLVQTPCYKSAGNMPACGQMDFIVWFSPDLKDEVKRTISEVTTQIPSFNGIRNPSKFLVSVDTATTSELHEYGKETLTKLPSQSSCSSLPQSGITPTHGGTVVTAMGYPHVPINARNAIKALLLHHTDHYHLKPYKN